MKLGCCLFYFHTFEQESIADLQFTEIHFMLEKRCIFLFQCLETFVFTLFFLLDQLCILMVLVGLHG